MAKSDGGKLEKAREARRIEVARAIRAVFREADESQRHLSEDELATWIKNAIAISIPDVTMEEFSIAAEGLRDDADTAEWLKEEIDVICARRGITVEDSSTVGDILAKAADAGDERAKELIEMGFGGA